MAWQQRFLRYGQPFRARELESRNSLDLLSVNELCFIRKEHRCGKIFGASKSCFIACPTDDNLNPILELMSEKLTKVGVEPIIAVKERAYGQDIFCTKICGKIIESRFCVAILDDTLVEETSIPNPNVYYEYGLMTSLRKHIIPLQKDDMDLAFNIQSHDTIKYKAANIGTELDRAIKDAVRITEAKDKDSKKAAVPEKALLRRLELSGLVTKDSDWFLHDAIADTEFMGFGQDPDGFYLYLGKIDDSTEYQDYIDDLGVVLYRTEKKADELSQNLKGLTAKKDSLEKDKQEADEKERKEQNQGEIFSAVAGRRVYTRTNRAAYASLIRETESDIADAQSKLSLMETFYIGFVLNPQLDADGFVDKIGVLIKQYKRYELCLSSGDTIVFGDVSVELSHIGY